MSSQVLDQHLQHAVRPYLISDYEVLAYTRQPGLRSAFLTGSLTDVHLQYTAPSYIQYCEVFAELKKIEILTEQSPAVVQRAYRPKLEEINNKFLLLQATAKQDDCSFFEHTKSLYGLPKAHYYHFTLRELRALLVSIEGRRFSESKVVEAVAALKPILEEAHVSTDWDLFKFPVIDTSDSQQVLSAEEIKQACEAAFKSLGIVAWKAVISRPGERITFSANQEERVIHIPNDADSGFRKYPLTAVRVKGLIAHEIGTHVLRSENGLKSPLGLLGTGLAGYLHGEEGIATYYEQKANGTNYFAGVLGYLATSWAVGLDGQPRNFRGLFEIMAPYLFLSVLEYRAQAQLAINFNQIEENARRNAWARCIRTFRGTTGATPGCCFTRDIMYLEGNIAIWELIQTDPTWEDKFSLGKYDPTNQEHVGILRDLGLL